MKTAHVPCELWRWRSERRQLADVHRAAGMKWSANLATLDIRFHEWGWALGARKPPGRRCLAEDWGWTEYEVRAFLGEGYDLLSPKHPGLHPSWREPELREAIATRRASFGASDEREAG